MKRKLLIAKRIIPLVVSAFVLSFVLNSTATETCDLVFESLNKRSFHEPFANSTLHPSYQEIQNLLMSRSVEQQATINALLTQLHAEKEMSFQTKNPKTGVYDKFVSVPVNAAVAPLAEVDFNRLVDSTGPVLRALRELLQKVYASRDLNIEVLGLTHIPRSEAELLIRVVRESIYFEPQLVDPVMKDYPFLPISAFDGAVVDPTQPKPHFFEMNSGTPSGLSNNAMLLDELAVADPQLYERLQPYLPPDTTFSLLKQTVDSAAKKWTGKDGISVVISPGTYNGAHPDVAMIAKKAGMPLVRSSDLYESDDGSIHLNLNLGAGDPVVTGVYGRMEESFFLQSQSDQIPMISPAYQNPSELEQRLGVQLRRGAIYDFEFDSTGQIVGVKKDANGRPQFLNMWSGDSIGKNPYTSQPHPLKPPTDGFLRAILSRNLYYSAIGGRVADDKRLFRIVSQYLAKSAPGQDVAHPIQGLTLGEYDKFYENPKSFVVKVPDNSGGVGIYFPRVMSESDVVALVETVKRKPPGTFEIQYISDIVTLPSIQRSESGAPERNDVAIDLRIFVFMDADGRVHAGPNSLLLRTAPKQSLYTNTSLGGGYGVGVVLSNTAQLPHAPEKEKLPLSDVNLRVLSRGQTVAAALELVKEMLSQLEEGTEVSQEKLKNLAAHAGLLSFQLREIMGELDILSIPLLGRLRELAQVQSLNRDEARVLESNLQWLETDLDHLRYRSSQRDPVGFASKNMPTRVDLRQLPEPSLYNYGGDSRSRFDRVELAEYLTVDNPAVQAIIDQVKAWGGEVRLPKMRKLFYDGRPPEYSSSLAYFWVSLMPESPGYLIPVIGIDLTGPPSRQLPLLEHEFAHLKFWMEIYHRHISDGKDPATAARATEAEVWTDENQVVTERLAVEAEMRAEREYPNGPYHNVKRDRPKFFDQPGYVNRITYPEFEALRFVFNKKGHLDKEKALKYMRDLVDVAVENRRLNGGNSFDSDLFKTLTHPFGIERLQRDGTVGLFQAILLEVCHEKSIPSEICLDQNSEFAKRFSKREQ